MDTVETYLQKMRTGAKDRPDYALAVWHINDVIDRSCQQGISISEVEAREVIGLVERKQDCSLGISWDTIDAYIDIIVEERSQNDAIEEPK